MVLSYSDTTQYHFKQNSKVIMCDKFSTLMLLVGCIEPVVLLQQFSKFPFWERHIPERLHRCGLIKQKKMKVVGLMHNAK